MGMASDGVSMVVALLDLGVRAQVGTWVHLIGAAALPAPMPVRLAR